jgi:hypothetical protein
VTLESLGLLVEEARTNLLVRSEEFDNASWDVVSTPLAVTANTQVSPAGSTTADTLANTANTSEQYRLVQFVTSSSQVAFSVFIQKGTHQFVQLRTNNISSGFVNFNLDLNSATATTATGSIVDAGSGWKRCTAIFAAQSITSVQINLISSAAAAHGEIWTPVGTISIYLWGAQLEAGAFPTSYIPTTTAAVTRSADVASIGSSAFSSWYRQDEGTMFGAATINGIAAQNYIAAIDAGAGFPDSHLYYAVTGTPRFETFVASAVQSQLIPAPATALTAGSQFAMAYAFKQDDFAAARNGGSAATDASGNMPTVNRLVIGSTGSVVQLNGTIRRLCFWPQRLSNASLQQITQ